MIDWFKVMTELKQHGMSCEQIAKEAEVSRKTIENWAASNGEPPYSKAIILIDVYISVIGSTEVIR
jgi:orotate phosphoribosyltransferase-like protein